ncbi:DUF1844 domain-containing protein [bacterium]|nr:DUF1844 domain-containing protein [bacterium]
MTDSMSKHDQVLLSLVMHLQSATMVQLGKIVDPTTGEPSRDLQAARATIDILEMLKAKCRHETPDDLVKLLDQAVMDLQMNYLDEMKRGDEPASEDDDDGAGDDGREGASS